jgi:signal transduction histidine kinase/CheY-like chemotaxis protein
MSIRQAFAVIAATLFALFAAIVYLMTLEVQNQASVSSAEERRYASYQLADELRQSSDNLTRMARTYVVTGNPLYEEYFRTILAIRNGEVARPENYGSIYWDFATAKGEEFESDGERVPLQTLMRRMHFTEAELAKLRESQDHSDTLVTLEDRAMAAMKGLYSDAEGRYRVRGERDTALARELLHGTAYHRAKAEIMAPIQEFIEMVETRTAGEIDTLRARSEALALGARVLVGLALVLLLLGAVLLQRRVVKPTIELARAAGLTETGDYTSRVPVRSKDEMGQLARSFNQMSSAIERDIEARDRSAAELAAAHEAADSANQAKSAFLANMSHELRTPMNAIIGYSEILIEDAEDDGNEEAVKDLGKIRSAGAHLLSLINDVLDLSKIEAGKMDLYVESFEIPRLIDEVTSTVDALIQSNDNSLTVELDPALGEARADVTKLRQSLFNLLSNATKFTHHGEIGLSVQGEQENGVSWLRLSVSDTGIGIPPEKIDHVFEEFSQAEESTTRNFGGTGLGLAITKRFCEMMGGEITLESRLGQGSTFTIRLPVEVRGEIADTQAVALAAVSPQPDEERIVLVVDDDPNALDLLGRTLQGAGVRVVTASDGREALRMARSLRPVAITLDVMMPNMDGWEVLSELKADPATREIPVIMVTMTDDRALGYAFGATEFLTKPVKRDRLIQLLDRYATRDSERRALVVDDKAENREILRHALEREGWQVCEAENGQVALAKVNEQTPSLILLDLMMPVMDGFEFVLEMRKLETSKPIPIVVVTAKDITDEDRRRLNGGVVGLIEKTGLDRESLLAQVLEQAGATRQT